MQYVSNVVNAPAAYAPDATAFEEQVVVTPCEKRARFGTTTMDESAFAARCVFSWRNELVTTKTAGPSIVYNRVRQIASFQVRGGLANYPRVGDRITRSWDGATFEILAVRSGPDSLTCSVISIDARLH